MENLHESGETKKNLKQELYDIWDDLNSSMLYIHCAQQKFMEMEKNRVYPPGLEFLADPERPQIRPLDTAENLLFDAMGRLKALEESI